MLKLVVLTGAMAMAGAAAPHAQAQAATDEQVAQAVDSQFPAYDANRDGALSADEFAAWMVALKRETAPGTAADSPGTRRWVDAAFTQADKDSSRSVTRTEVIGFMADARKG